MTRNLFIFIILSVLSADMHAQQQTFRARVVDATTGEPLPYASIYWGEGKGTLTNAEGDFMLEADEDDVLKIAYIGYKTFQKTAISLPQVVRMEPMTRVLREVIVQGGLDSLQIAKLLTKTWKRLCRDYYCHKGKKSNYFYRMTHIDTDKKELAEALVVALSANNLRGLSFLSGKHYCAPSDSTSKQAPHFTDSNLHLLLQVGPMTEDVPFWQAALKPFVYLSPQKNESRTIQLGSGTMSVTRVTELHRRKIEPAYYYDVSCEQLESSKKNARIYKIQLKSKLNSAKDTLRSRLEGDIYIDHKCRLLAFDGRLLNYSMIVRDKDVMVKHPMTCHLHVDYTHERRFTEVEKSYCSIFYGEMKVHLLLFRLPKDFMSARQLKTVKVNGNMLKAIEEVGYNPEFWTQEIMLRTQEEERIIQQDEKENSITDKP